MAYSKKVVDKFEKTLNEPAKFNVGRFNPKDIDVGTGMVGAPACGDVMKLQIKVNPTTNIHEEKLWKILFDDADTRLLGRNQMIHYLLI